MVPQGEEEGRPEVVGHLGVVGEEVLLLPEVGVEVGAGLHHPDRWTQVVGHLGASWRWLAASPSSTHFCSKHSQGHQPWSPPCLLSSVTVWAEVGVVLRRQKEEVPCHPSSAC